MSSYSNPVPPREIPHQALAELMAEHGWEQAVIVYRREGNVGGEGITCAGLGYRNGRVAEEIMSMMKKIMGMQPDTSALDDEIRKAEAEMSEGRTEDNGLTTGQKSILPTIERTRGPKRKEEIDPRKKK